MHNFSVFNQNLDQISKSPNLVKNQFVANRRDKSNLRLDINFIFAISVNIQWFIISKTSW